MHDKCGVLQKGNMNNTIIGNGDIASVLKKVEPKGLLFFASGVSNSNNIDEEEFRREKVLLLQQDRKEHLVYFSSICALKTNSRYCMHKREMEELVEYYFKQHTIVRIGNITWGKNPNTIINYLKNKIEKGEFFNIRDEYRHIIDKEEFIYWMNLIPTDRSTQINVPGRMVKVKQIVEEIIAGKL